MAACNSSSICKLFEENKPVKFCAPMVRYSRLPFRKLVRKYRCHVACTPMIVSNSFVRSQKARDANFTTDPTDRPLVVQFAASNVEDFSAATALVAPFVDAVDLNCGCPQQWALKEQYGAYLINEPQLVCEMVRTAINRTALPVSIKIRVHDDLRQTVELAQRAERVGVAWITVHGRTVNQRTEPSNLEAIKLVKEGVSIPVVANGDVQNEGDVTRVVTATGVDGVMAARGILRNPAMFGGYETTPIECVHDWLDYSLSCGVTFAQFHQHLIFMLENVLAKTERRVFNNLISIPAVLDFLDSNYGIRCRECLPLEEET